MWKLLSLLAASLVDVSWSLRSGLLFSAIPLAFISTTYNSHTLSAVVSMLIETAQPSIDYTQRKYGNAHDAVVASATYNRTLEAAAEILQRLQVSAASIYSPLGGTIRVEAMHSFGSGSHL